MHFSDLQLQIMDSNATQSQGSRLTKRRRNKSLVWDYFTVEAVDSDNSRAFCKQCKKSFAYVSGSKPAGTSHLLRHITRGICPGNRLNQGEKQLTLYMSPSQDGSASCLPKRKRERGNCGATCSPFDKESCIHHIARMIILHQYPLQMVNEPGFMDFARVLEPKLDGVSFETVQNECLSIYLKEKYRLAGLLGGISRRVSVTLDLWTSDQTMGYAILRGHFVDCNWTLQHRILNVVMVPFPESEVAFNHAIMSCLSNWDLWSKLFSLTLDDSCASEAVIQNVHGLVSINNLQTSKSRYVIRSCLARTLTRLALEAIGRTKSTVEKVRECVKFVITSNSHKQKFNDLKQQLQVPSTANLVIDNTTRWDSTYHMLSAASKLKEVFFCLDNCDIKCQALPTMDDWKKIEALCGYLKLFFDTANVLSGEARPTINEFFLEVYKIRYQLIGVAGSPDSFVRSLGQPMNEMFEKYWSENCVILAMAAVMDPRYKLKLVEFIFNKRDNENGVSCTKLVEEAVFNLFHEYTPVTYTEPNFDTQQTGDASIESHKVKHEAISHYANKFSDFEVFLTKAHITHTKPDLDRYLKEAILPRGTNDFDILGWWKLNEEKYPILAKMAADLLSLPVSTVAPDHIFDTTSVKLDSYWSSLNPNTLEALVCAKDWLQCVAQDSTQFTTAVVKMEAS